GCAPTRLAAVPRSERQRGRCEEPPGRVPFARASRRHPMIVARNLTQRYRRAGGGPPLTVLEAVDLDVADGEVVAGLGPSGSGKRTLLGLLAGLDRASEGSVRVDGVAIDDLDEDARAALRAERIGFVFQTFQLLPTLTALENVRVPLELLPEGRAPAPAEA